MSKYLGAISVWVCLAALPTLVAAQSGAAVITGLVVDDTGALFRAWP